MPHSTDRSVDYESVLSLVELAISMIPNAEQGNKCRELIEKEIQPGNSCPD